MEQGKAEPIEVEATPIDTEVVEQTEHDRWLASVRERVANVERWQPHEIADAKDASDSKKCRTEVRAVIAEVDAERKARTKDLNDLLKRVKADTDAILAPLKEADEGYKAAIDAWDAAELEAQLARMAEAYADMAPWLAVAEDGTAGPVPWERVLEHYGTQQRWRNKLTWPKREESLARVVDEIAKNVRTIDGDPRTDAEKTETKAEYFATLDFSQTLRNQQARIEQRRKTEELERRQAEQRAAEEEAARRERAQAEAVAKAEECREKMRAAPQRGPAMPEPICDTGSVVRSHNATLHVGGGTVEVPMAPEPAPVASMPQTWHIVVDCEFRGTREQAMEVGAFMKAHGITGKISPVRR